MVPAHREVRAGAFHHRLPRLIREISRIAKSPLWPMTLRLTLFALGSVGLQSIATAEWIALYGHEPEPSTTIRVAFDGGKILQIPLRRFDLRATALVLRRDTERADYFWLEVEMPQTIDSDGYLLVIHGHFVGQIYTRGNKWAIGFDSIEKARCCLEYLREFHHLDSQHVRDATKI